MRARTSGMGSDMPRREGVHVVIPSRERTRSARRVGGACGAPCGGAWGRGPDSAWRAGATCVTPLADVDSIAHGQGSMAMSERVHTSRPLADLDLTHFRFTHDKAVYSRTNPIRRPHRATRDAIPHPSDFSRSVPRRQSRACSRCYAMRPQPRAKRKRARAGLGTAFCSASAR